VVSASISSHTPLSGSRWTEAVAPKGHRLPDRDNAILIAAGPNFFGTLRTPLAAGRDFSGRADGNGNVAIVNQKFAARYFPGRNPVGEYLTATVSKPPTDLQIVGVVRDSSTINLRVGARPTVYVPYFRGFSPFGALEIRAAGSLSQVASAIRKAIQPSFPKTPIEVRALTNQVEQTLIQERLMAKLAAGFGILGLLLSCVGLYGLLAYSVVRRTKEIGVRMALGARRSSVLWMVAWGALRLLAIGVAIGVPIAWALSRRVASMFFGLQPTDPGVVATAVLLLGTAAMIAAYVPARFEFTRLKQSPMMSPSWPLSGVRWQRWPAT